MASTTQLGEHVGKGTGVSHLLHTYGAPCQQVSGPNTGRVGVQGQRSGLVNWINQLRKIMSGSLHKKLSMGEVGENV